MTAAILVNGLLKCLLQSGGYSRNLTALNQSPEATVRIAVTTSYGHWGADIVRGVFEPNVPAMVGGGETALLWLSRCLAESGHHVDLFYDTRPCRLYGINFLPKAMKVSMLLATDYDILISWEDTESLQVGHRAFLVIYAAQCNTMQIGVLDYGVDWYQCVSEWHVEQMYRTDPTVSPEKFCIVPNGIDLTRYCKPYPERDPLRIIHSSSPDRGLHNLLEMWPKLRRAVPGVTLHIYYDIQRWFDLVDFWTEQGVTLSTTDRAGWLREGLKRTEGHGVFAHGPVGQWELAQHQMESSLLLYPCSPQGPTEGFSNTVLESLAAGTPVLTSNADAFPELWSEVTVQVPLIEPEESFYALTEEEKNQHFRERQHLWVEAARNILTSKAKWRRMSRAGRELAQGYGWQDIGAAYVESLMTKYQQKQEAEKPKGWVQLPPELHGVGTLI